MFLLLPDSFLPQCAFLNKALEAVTGGLGNLPRANSCSVARPLPRARFFLQSALESQDLDTLLNPLHECSGITGPFEPAFWIGLSQLVKLPRSHFRCLELKVLQSALISTARETPCLPHAVRPLMCAKHSLLPSFFCRLRHARLSFSTPFPESGR